MAQPIVSPENLYQAVEEIKEHIDSGSKTTYIYTAISNRTTNYKKLRLYLAIDPDFDVSDCTLQFARYNVVRDKKKTVVWDDENEEYLTVTQKTKHNSWHLVWAIPLKLKKPLFDKLQFKSNPISYNNKLLYEVTWDGYDSFYDFLDEDLSTGYAHIVDHEQKNVTYKDMVCSAKCGIALIKNGKIVSNYSAFKGLILTIPMNHVALQKAGYTEEEIYDLYATLCTLEPESYDPSWHSIEDMILHNFQIEVPYLTLIR